jgi:hypothetical protein
MAVMVKKSDLRHAKVLTVHYGKNIAFTDFTTSSSILRKVAKANYTERLDLNRTNFRNEGEAVYFYAKSHSLVLYDKVKDLNKAKSRSVEKEKAFNLQMDIFEEIRKKNRKPRRGTWRLYWKRLAKKAWSILLTISFLLKSLVRFCWIIGKRFGNNCEQP